MNGHYERIVALSSGAAERYLANQDTAADSRYFGGYVNPKHGYAEAGGSGSAAATLLSFYLCPEHPRRRDPLLLDRAGLLLDYLLRKQHDDGTVDLRTTNFHDATMVGFVTQTLGYTYRLLAAAIGGESRREGTRLREIQEKIETFLRRGAEGMRTGGFHTPNHRWVLASALSLCYRILDDDRYRIEAEHYLAEGIDCTDEGEYTERSVGVYNVVNNRSLIIMANELGRPELLDPVARNLEMVLNYIEPDETLFTANSRRQDRGSRIYPAPYYENYLLMAHLRGDRQSAEIADAILWQIESGRGSAGAAYGTLTRFLLDSSLREGPPWPDSGGEAPASARNGGDFGGGERAQGADSSQAFSPPAVDETGAASPIGSPRGSWASDNSRGGRRRAGFPTTYRFYSEASQIVRMRDGLVSTSVLGADEEFLRFRVGDAGVSVRVHGTFYGARGRFRPNGIERDGDAFVLSYSDRWGYVRPFETPPSTSVWDDMPHHQRERVHLQDYKVTATIRPSGRLVELELRFEGVAEVLTRVEMIFLPGGTLDTDGLRVPGASGGWALMRGNEAVYSIGADRIRVHSHGGTPHAYAADMRGGQDPASDSFTLYAAGVTPETRRLTLCAEGRCDYTI